MSKPFDQNPADHEQDPEPNGDRQSAQTRDPPVEKKEDEHADGFALVNLEKGKTAPGLCRFSFHRPSCWKRSPESQRFPLGERTRPRGRELSL